VEDLAKAVEVLIVYGWTEGMTNRMLEVGRAWNPNVCKIEKVEDLRAEWFAEKERVGVIGANETPDWMVDEAIDRIRSMAS
jgi:4-hydroxy-3-methylbut-2-enyl diphosphate reductase IspH